MSSVSRRDFLKGSLAVAGATFAIGTSARPVLGANEALNIGVAGINGRGQSHMSAYLGMKDVRITYLIDPDSRIFEARAKRCEMHGGKKEEYEEQVKDKKTGEMKTVKKTRVTGPGPNGKPQCVQDIRKALEDKNLDAVSIASTNSTHSLLAIWSMQAGKDVYVEKPATHNVHEGRMLVETAKKHQRMLQHGTQSRGSSGWAKAAALARSGQLGKLAVSYGWASKPRSGIGFKKPEPVPNGLDFNLWLGPAPEQPFHRNLVHYNWHWFWDFGNADTGNQGVHQMDIARWGLPDDHWTKPFKVMSLGGRFAFNDQGQTPNAHLTLFDFGNYQLIFESCNLVTRGDKKKDIPNTVSVSNAYHTEKGVLDSGGFTPKGGKREKLPDIKVDMGAGGDIFNNFIQCVRTRDEKGLLTGPMACHLSSALCHLGAIACRIGSVVPFAESRKIFGDHAAAVASLDKMEWRMKSRGVKIDDSLKYQVGPVLTFDPTVEKFVGNDKANALLTRNYRKPFVVPDKVV
ncbi:MAG: Gfo/Idh/MocA family oxidoreductase [Candidatus Brocadiae bacterium]|nr:Gfo/Idh/MocA family oxidoreductase [Candidatus Brocadiia bacterium]